MQLLLVNKQQLPVCVCTLGILPALLAGALVTSDLSVHSIPDLLVEETVLLVGPRDIRVRS